VRLGCGTLRVALNRVRMTVWGDRYGLARRHIQVQQGEQAARGRKRLPVTDGVAALPTAGLRPCGLGPVSGPTGHASAAVIACDRSVDGVDVA